MNKEERLMMSEEEVRQRAKELLNLPKEHLITQYMFLEQENKQLKEKIDKAIKELEILRNRLLYEEDFCMEEVHIDEAKAILERGKE